MNSSWHRENLLGDHLDHGAGVVIGDDGRVWATQNFGSNC